MEALTTIYGKIIRVGGDPCTFEIDVVGTGRLTLGTSRDWAKKIVLNIYRTVKIEGVIYPNGTINVRSCELFDL